MNAVEIEEALSTLAEKPFDAAEFPFQFLEAFGNKETTLKRLRKGESNASDLPNGVLQRNNIHIAVCPPGQVGETLKALRDSPKTAQAKAKFILATDGQLLEAEELASSEVLACEFKKFPDHFGFLLPLAGISTIKEIKDNPIDIKATGRLNKLYVELLSKNPDWAKTARRPDMNHFMARLVFCYFAEDTDIFQGESLFTSTLERMTESDGSNTAQVLETIFRAMNLQGQGRAAAKLPRWAEVFPYVNGGLFGGSTDVPTFTKIARSYLLRAGNLNWKEINPDIFGSMIQAVTDEDERGELGMHYTSVPNILKVLNPLFLDDLRAQLEAADDNKIKLLNLRKRMARIRVFDPACGSGNFLVIAYKQMRAIEWEINKRRGEDQLKSEIPISNFRGIELRDFPAEIARLALIIAEFQCDVLYRGQQEALSKVLPLDSQNWITCGNALRLDWLAICPPTGTGVKLMGDDLFNAPLEQAEINFENEGGETYICGNPPYLGNKLQSEEQKADLAAVFEGRLEGWKSLDYVAAWLMKAVDYGLRANAASAFVVTNSVCQGQQVPILWPYIFTTGHQIDFAYTSFKWSNLASNNAGVVVIIVGISNTTGKKKRLYQSDADGAVLERLCENINPYLVDSQNLVIAPRREAPGDRASMHFGNMPRDGGHLLASYEDMVSIDPNDQLFTKFLKRYVGSEDFIQGKLRYCLWIDDDQWEESIASPAIARRLEAVREMRLASKAGSTRDFAKLPYRFVQIQGKAKHYSLIVPRVSSERRPFLPVGLLDATAIIADSAFALYDAPLWSLALIASRLHLVWVAAVCGKLKTDYRYSNTLGWNSFPIPLLTEKNKEDLTRCAKDILVAREQNFPATIADLYDAELMPANLRHAHELNDEVLERIYIGRRFRNDTERLERLFAIYADGQTGLAPGVGSRSRLRGKK